MGHYSIKDLEQLSGIKAHTIRIWEQRYGLLHPDRTQSNIRTYDDEELRYLLNVSLLANHGYKISRISELSREEVKHELNNLLLDSTVDSLPLGDSINGMILAMLELNERRFTEIINKQKAVMKFESMVLELFYPFLRKVGIMWGVEQTNPAQEHFVSNLVRRKILAELDKLAIPDKTKPGIILFLRESELHEIGLVLIDYVLRSRGYTTYYLGQNVPARDVLDTLKISDADALITYFVKPMAENGQENYLIELELKAKKPVFYNSYNADLHLTEKHQNIRYVPDIQSLISEIESL